MWKLRTSSGEGGWEGVFEKEILSKCLSPTDLWVRLALQFGTATRTEKWKEPGVGGSGRFLSWFANFNFYRFPHRKHNTLNVSSAIFGYVEYVLTRPSPTSSDWQSHLAQSGFGQQSPIRLYVCPPLPAHISRHRAASWHLKIDKIMCGHKTADYDFIYSFILKCHQRSSLLIPVISYSAWGKHPSRNHIKGQSWFSSLSEPRQ